MNKPVHVIKNENGSVMVIAIIILMLLTLIGIAITTTASLELQIAGNDRLHKIAFYKADGGTEIGAEVLEQNLGCMGGFTTTSAGQADIKSAASTQAVAVTSLTLWENLTASMPSDTNRDFFFPANYGSGPHTNVTVGGNTVLSTGTAIQMVSGYEGKGKGAGGGGAFILYDMISQHQGVVNSRSTVQVQWRHVIGQEGSCNF